MKQQGSGGGGTAAVSATAGGGNHCSEQPQQPPLPPPPPLQLTGAPPPSSDRREWHRVGGGSGGGGATETVDSPLCNHHHDSHHHDNHHHDSHHHDNHHHDNIDESALKSLLAQQLQLKNQQQQQRHVTSPLTQNLIRHQAAAQHELMTSSVSGPPSWASELGLLPEGGASTGLHRHAAQELAYSSMASGGPYIPHHHGMVSSASYPHWYTTSHHPQNHQSLLT